MAICPILSVMNMQTEIADEKQCYVECLQEKCQWYIRRSARMEIYDCAISTLATYLLPHYRQER
jgi:hypothetical protein